MIYAGTQGYFDSLDPKVVLTTGIALVQYIRKMHNTVLHTLQTGGELTKDLEEKLKSALKEFFELNPDSVE